MWMQRLAEAETALHKLNTGAAVQSLSYDGESVTFTPTSLGKLRNWIGELRVALGLQSISRPRSRRVSFR
ncbi:phage tail protein [Oricola thermophila]|uniref:Phage tail protein n=2 Tax=Oricola thermophila TaxID=2742145 RepID=A0A6N1VIM9_9HYPH|nr:phage tail protein [Oricola thermophila]